MRYYVTLNKPDFDLHDITIISPDKAIELINDWDTIQFDTETSGVDARIAKVLCAQFGNDSSDTRIVVNTSEVDLKLFKPLLESKMIVGQNLYFDLQFLYSYGIICTKIYDTMIVEQLLYLGYPSVNSGGPSMSLKAIAKRRLNVHISKDIRGQIIWRGLDYEVLNYALNDVVYLERIMNSQLRDCKSKDCINAAKLECKFIPALAYCAWCGIKIDVDKWKAKMKQQESILDSTINKLNEFIIKNNNPKFVYVSNQADLFLGYDPTPKVSFTWGKIGVKTKKDPIIDFIESLGFNVYTLDKKTKLPKRSIDLKELKKQKGINDEFLKLYITYSEAYKVCTTYGITYLNAINPITGRIHTQFKAIAADTGRVACNSNEDGDDVESIKINPDLAKLKGFPLKTNDITLKCGYPNIQTLPADEITRSCFIPEEGNVFCSCDWSAIESRLGADIYNEKAMIDEFLHGSGDLHSLVASKIFKELANVPVKDIKTLYPDLRKKAKPVELDCEDSL